jgi:hypothetical protein
MMDIVTELNPNYPAWMHWQMVKVHLARREYGLAIKELEMTQTGWWFWTHAFLAAAHCGDGDTARGREELEAALALNPGFAEVYWADMYFWNKSDDVRPMFDAVNHGLEACGWEVPPDPGREAFAQQPCDPRRLGANRSRRLLRLVSRQAVTRRRRRQGRQQHL